MWLKLFSHPRCLPMVALFGALLTLPALNSGLMLDDFLHWAILTGQAHEARPGSPWGLFNFIDGQGEKIQALKATGRLMWWAADDVQLSFWRPLSEWTHWLDYQLWPASPLLMHAHSTLWYGLLVYLLGRLYLQLLPSRAQAGLATFIFAVSSLHLLPVTWLAARNQLIAGCFTVLAIGAFHRWRHTGASRHAWLAGAWLSLALLSAEAALSTVGYLAAYCLVYAPSKPLYRRLMPLLPYLAIVIVWRLAYNHLGFGSANSTLYIDPGAAPLRFASVLLMRLPALMMAELFGIPSLSVNNLLPQALAMYALVATLITIAFLMAARACGLWQTPLARFLGLGTLFALVPMCASEPNDRLLMNAELGASALLAMLLAQMIKQPKATRGWLAQGGRLLLMLSLFVHLVLFPLQMVAYASLQKRITSPVMYDKPLSLPDTIGLPDEHIVLINPPVAALVFYYPVVRQYFGARNPASMHALSNGRQDLHITRIDASTLKISSGPKGFTDSMSRDTTMHPIQAGKVLKSGPFDVTVTEVSPQGVPLSALFHFTQPLQDRGLRFYLWTDDGFVPFSPPSLGESVTLAALDMRNTFMRRIKAP